MSYQSTLVDHGIWLNVVAQHELSTHHNNNQRVNNFSKWKMFAYLSRKRLSREDEKRKTIVNYRIVACELCA